MNEIWYSRQWDNAPMPHAVFFMKDGHAIHGSNDVRDLGKPASHGCVRISPENATTLFGLVKKSGLENTHVELTGQRQAASTKAHRQALPVTVSRSPARTRLGTDMLLKDTRPQDTLRRGMRSSGRSLLQPSARLGRPATTPPLKDIT
jgi:L,D-transpeptidase-like protein